MSVRYTTKVVSSVHITATDPSFPGSSTEIVTEHQWATAKRIVELMGPADYERYDPRGYPIVAAIRLLKDCTPMSLREAKAAIEAAWYEAHDA